MILTHTLFILLFLSLGATLGLALYQMGVDRLQATIMAVAVWISEPFVVHINKKWEERVYWLAVLMGALVRILLPVWLLRGGMAAKSAQLISIATATGITILGLFGAAPLTRLIKRRLHVD